MSEPAPAAPVAEPVAPAAPAPAPEASAPAPEPASVPDATPASATTPTEGATAEQVAKYLGTDVATLEKFTKFAENNGKFDGAFTKMKDAISRPQQPATPPELAKAPEPPQNGSQRPPEGVFTMQELAMANYFERLSKEPAYASIAKEIADGSVLVKAQKMGLSPVTPDGINDRQLRDYLDLYAASKPAQPTSPTPTADTQVDYVKIDKVTSMDEANRIELQNIQLRKEGKPEHPLSKEAREFVRAHYQNKK